MNDSKSMGDKVEALGANINDTVQDLIRDAKPLLNQATDRINRGHDAADHVAHMIRHEPFKAMLIAAGIGAATVALVGILTRRHTHTHTQSH